MEQQIISKKYVYNLLDITCNVYLKVIKNSNQQL